MPHVRLETNLHKDRALKERKLTAREPIGEVNVASPLLLLHTNCLLIRELFALHGERAQNLNHSPKYRCKCQHRSFSNGRGSQINQLRASHTMNTSLGGRGGLRQRHQEKTCKKFVPWLPVGKSELPFLQLYPSLPIWTQVPLKIVWLAQWGCQWSNSATPTCIGVSFLVTGFVNCLGYTLQAAQRNQRAWHLLQQMYPQRSFPKISTAKGLSVRWSSPPKLVALSELNKSVPETARTAENMQFNSCCTVAERRKSHSLKEDWLAKNRDPGSADTFSDSGRVPAPGKQCQITQTQLSRDKWSPASSLCSSTISLLNILSWSTAMTEILLFSLFGDKTLRSHFQKFTEKVWS